jgi:isopentenyl-diphosphate delta-isomerase
VFLKDAAGHWLLQRRAAGKYHSPNLWTNSCCGHPMLGEPTEDAAQRRLHEELGIRASLQCLRWHSYRTDVTASLIENELVGIYLARYEGPVRADPEEVAEWRWVEPDALLREVESTPLAFTAWFRNYLPVFGAELLAWRQAE